MTAGQEPKPLIWADKEIGGAQKAENADRVIFTQQTFSEFPDYWVSDATFASPRKVTDANPILKEYAWGSKVLIDFTNSKGQKLQGTLTLPAGYQPGKKYPMLVYFYEIMSNTHHTFSMPVFDDRPQMSTYASNGYLVFQPDVVYEIGKPGTSAVDCVTSGVKKVIELGLRGSEAHRPAGAQLGRIPVVVHRDADGHVRRGRHRRAADGPHQLLRRALQADRHRAAGHHGSGPGAHGRERHAVDRKGALRAAVAGLQRHEDQDAVHDPAGHAPTAPWTGTRASSSSTRRGATARK